MEEVGLPRAEGFRELPLGQRKRVLMWGGGSSRESWGGEKEED